MKKYSKGLYAAAEKNKVLISSHRGQAGTNIIENTVPAFKNALLHGADIVEMDIAMSTDGKYYTFHDGNEMRLLRTEKNIRTMTSKEIENLDYYNYEGMKSGGKINRFEDVLKELKGKCFINIDRCWDLKWRDFNYPLGAFELIRKYGMEEQIIYKTNINEYYLSQMSEHGVDLMYMPIVSSSEDVEKAESYGLNIVALELLFPTEDNPIINDGNLAAWHDKGYLLWANSINVYDDFILSGGHDDVHAIKEGTEAWDFLLDKGIDIIQTDWPAVLKNYLNGKFRQA